MASLTELTLTHNPSDHEWQSQTEPDPSAVDDTHSSCTSIATVGPQASSNQITHVSYNQCGTAAMLTPNMALTRQQLLDPVSTIFSNIAVVSVRA